MKDRTFAGARALYRAAGVDAKDFGKPIVAIANSFTEFVPGHVHLQQVGRIVSEAVKAAGGIRSREDMERFIALGADRLGTSSAIRILGGESAGMGY